MDLLFEPSFGLIAGLTYWWWYILLGKYIGILLGVKVGHVGATDALDG